MEDYFFFPSSLEAGGGYVKADLGGHAASRNHVALSPTPRGRASRDHDERAAGELLRRHHHHFLDACFRCGQRLAANRDIFMYRGDTPFSSEDCRQHDIEADEAREKRPRHQPAAGTREPRLWSSSSSPQRVSVVWAQWIGVLGTRRTFFMCTC